MKIINHLRFLWKNKYYITSLNCKLKLKEYIHQDKKFKKLSAKSRILLEKGAAYLCDTDYLTLRSTWYVKKNDKTYQFKLWPDIIHQYSYKYKFWDTLEKRIRDCQICSPFSYFIRKDFTFERALTKGLNLIVRLNENQTYIESFFLHRSTSGGTENINFVLGRSYYRDIYLYFVYDR